MSLKCFTLFELEYHLFLFPVLCQKWKFLFSFSSIVSLVHFNWPCHAVMGNEDSNGVCTAAFSISGLYKFPLLPIRQMLTGCGWKCVHLLDLPCQLVSCCLTIMLIRNPIEFYCNGQSHAGWLSGGLMDGKWQNNLKWWQWKFSGKYGKYTKLKLDLIFSVGIKHQGTYNSGFNKKYFFQDFYKCGYFSKHCQ